MLCCWDVPLYVCTKSHACVCTLPWWWTEMKDIIDSDERACTHQWACLYPCIRNGTSKPIYLVNFNPEHFWARPLFKDSTSLSDFCQHLHYGCTRQISLSIWACCTTSKQRQRPLLYLFFCLPHFLPLAFHLIVLKRPSPSPCLRFSAHQASRTIQTTHLQHSSLWLLTSKPETFAEKKMFELAEWP